MAANASSASAREMFIVILLQSYIIYKVLYYTEYYTQLKEKVNTQV
jgi:hypothetical protein